MEQRQEYDETVLVSHMNDFRCRQGIHEKIAVGQEGALGPSRGAGRVEYGRDIVSRMQRRFKSVRLNKRMRKFREGEQRERVGTGEPCNGSGAVRVVQTDSDSGILQDEVDLFSSKQIVERQYDPAAPDDAEVGRDVMRTVMTEERHRVSALHAVFDQLRCEHDRQPVHFLVGKLFTFELDKGRARGQARALAQDLVEGHDLSYHACEYSIVGKVRIVEKWFRAPRFAAEAWRCRGLFNR